MPLPRHLRNQVKVCRQYTPHVGEVEGIENYVDAFYHVWLCPKSWSSTPADGYLRLTATAFAECRGWSILDVRIRDPTKPKVGQNSSTLAVRMRIHCNNRFLELYDALND